MAVTIKWLQSHRFHLTWLQHPLSQTLEDMLAPPIEQLQQWNLPLATTGRRGHLSPSDNRKMDDLPLAIPSQQFLPTCSQSLFPTRGYFGSNIKAQLKTAFFNTLSHSLNLNATEPM